VRAFEVCGRDRARGARGGRSGRRAM